MANNPHVRAADRYVRDVLAGKRISVCRWVRLACQRHLDDVEAAKSPDYPYEFKADKADRVCRFIERFPHTKGVWAAKHEPFVLQPWQSFLVCSLFGWVRKRDQLRRFRKCLILVPRKSGKSDLAARIGLWMLASDGEMGAEVYSGATSEKQAWEVFRPALMMTKAMPQFQAAQGVTTFKQSIAIPSKSSRFEPLIGKPGDGASPSCAIVDEYHEHTDDALAQTMLTGMGARQQPLIIFVSTAGENTAGPCYQMMLEAQRMLDGLVQDDELFALTYGLDDSEYDVKIQSSSLMQRLERLCTCSCAHAEVISRSWLKAYATVVTNKRDGGKIRAGVQITQTDLPEPWAFAEPATNRISLSETQDTNNGNLPNDNNGHPTIGSGSTQQAAHIQRGTQSVVGSTPGDTERKSAKKNTDYRIGKESGAGLAGSFRSLSTGEYTPNSMDAALSAPDTTKLYALITATPPTKLEACFASNATLRSVFLETMKLAYFAHSPTCEARKRIKPSEDLSWMVTEGPDDWTDPAMLRKANPNYGVSVSEDFLLARHADAMANARQQGVYQIKHLNRWVGAKAPFFDLPKWLACKRDIVPETFHGRRAWLGLDLASTIDINAVVVLLREGAQYTAFGRFYLPEAEVEKSSNKHLQAWHREGRLIVTPGEIVDLEWIRDDILELARQFQIADMGYDPFQATMLVSQLMKEGLKCVEVRPTVLNFSQPMKQLDGLIRSGKIEHDGCPVMTWMIGNVTAHRDAKDNVYPRKARDENKIDGVVALIMALARASVEEAPVVSVYEQMARAGVQEAASEAKPLSRYERMVGMEDLYADEEF